MAVTPPSRVRLAARTLTELNGPVLPRDVKVTLPADEGPSASYENAPALPALKLPPEKLPPVKLGAEGVAKAWADLAGADAPRAFKARWALAAAPDEALPLLQANLRPARPADPELLRGLLADLDGDRFEAREKAQAALEELEDLAEAALRRALTGTPTLEFRRRAEAVLKKLRAPVPSDKGLELRFIDKVMKSHPQLFADLKPAG